MVPSCFLAAHLEWFSLTQWLLFIGVSLPIPGCSQRLVQSTNVAARMVWFSQFFWRLSNFVSIALGGCSKDVVPSGSRAAPCLCFLPNCWLLGGVVSVLDYGCSAVLFQIRICGCSNLLFRSDTVATQLSCFCRWLWLL